jgi:D-alanyl-D-alanine dipeptidase
MLEKIALVSLSLFTITAIAQTKTPSLPDGFVYLRDIDPTIQQDMRYAGYHNFIGHPIAGYQQGATCILTRPAAKALAKVQTALRPKQLSLKVFDCYRPQTAVNEFITWSQQPEQQQMKAEFYPGVDKKDFFTLGYVAAKSGHSRGSTMDLTIVPVPTPASAQYQPSQKLVSCTAPYDQRFFDSGLDMGTGFDCMDERSHGDNRDVSAEAQQNRAMLQQVMQENGFVPYAQEWWHFTLKAEPYPDTYFDFPVRG